MGSIYQRGDRFWISYQDKRTGKRVRRSAGSTRAEAVRALASAEGRKAALTVDQVLEAYLSHLRVRAKQRSVKGAESCSRKLLEWFGGADATKLRSKDIDAFVKHRTGEGVKPKTVNGDLAVLRAALRYGVDARLIPELPIKVRLLRVGRKRILPILSAEDIRNLLGHSWDPYYGVILVAAHTGFRLSEILHLTWSDVFFDELRLAVRAKQGWEAKSYEERAVYVPTTVIEYLRRRKTAASGSYVFGTSNDRPISPSNACRALRKIWKRAGLYEPGVPMTHWIRHTACSRLLGEGVDVETVRRIMGHSDAATTLLYAQSSDERLRAAAVKLNLGE